MSRMDEEIRERAREVGVEVWLHACEIDGTACLGIGSTEPVVTASVFKIPVALELARQAAAGALDLAEPVEVSADPSVPSPYGLATFRHPSRLSLDSLATLMIGISDNVATDLLFARIGKPAVRELLRALGLGSTAIEEDCAELLGTIGEDLGVDYVDDEQLLDGRSVAEISRLRALDPARTNRTTPADMTRLLGLIWRDEAGAPAACADVRRWLGHQVWPHRLRAGFSTDDVRVSGKTGTLPMIRNEVGVVEYDSGERFAVSVFTRAQDARAQAPERDAFIGFAASHAIAALRDAGAGADAGLPMGDV